MITDKMLDEIKEVYKTQISEHASGRLFCTNYGLKKIALILGLNYELMGNQKRKSFRNDVISGFQMGVFRKTSDY